MKKLSLLLLLLTIGFNAHSQDSEIKDEQQIINVINQFFESLETKDSLLMRKTTLATAFKS